MTKECQGTTFWICQLCGNFHVSRWFRAAAKPPHTNHRYHALIDQQKRNVFI